MREKTFSVSEIKDVIDKQYKRNERVKGYEQRCIEDIVLLNLLIGDYLLDGELGNIEDGKDADEDF
jgi:hypothetical protein